MNTNNRENSERTFETVGTIITEITSQVTRKLDEMKAELNSQLLAAINSAITEEVLLSIQNTQYAGERNNSGRQKSAPYLGLKNSKRT